MAITELKLTLNPSSSTPYEYVISQIQSVSGPIEKPGMTISPPGQSYKNQIIMGLEGQTKNLTIDFRLHDGRDSSDETIDKANGTAPQDGTFSDTDGDTTEDVVTIDEQITYLQDYIYDAGLSVTWTLTGERFGTFTDPTSGIEVFIDSIDFDIISRTSHKWKDCRLELTVGESI